MLGLRVEIGDVRLPLLPVAVDAAVPLLEDHQRPGNVEVDQLVTEEVEVEAFARDVGGKQQAHWRAVAPEVLDHLLEVDVLDAGAVDNGDLVGLQLQVAGEVLFEETQRLDTLGEEDDAVVGIRQDPSSESHPASACPAAVGTW